MNIELYAALDADLAYFYETYPELSHPYLAKERERIFDAAPDPAQADNVTFALFSEITAPRMGFDRDDAPQKKYYDYICNQIYCFFTAKGYEEEHFTAIALKDMLITTTAVEIVRQTNWNAALVTAAVTLVLSTTVRVGIRAWCQYYADKHPEVKS